MRGAIGVWTALFGLLALVGCGAGGSKDRINGKDNPGGGGSAGTTGAGGGGPNIMTNGRDAVAQRCPQAQLAPPQLRRLTAKELDRTLRDVFPSLGASWGGVKLGEDPTSSLGFSNDAKTLVVASQTAQELLDTAQDVATTLTTGTALGAVVPCAADAGAARPCADTLVQTVGARLFRRAVTTDEAANYGALYDSVAAKSDFATGARWVLVALIQSPNAVYRSELGTDQAGTAQLTPGEIATELAYTFGGTTPSADLLAAAASGALATPEARVAKAKELMATPSGHEQLQEFLSEWSGFGRVESKTKPNVMGFDAAKVSMLQETKLFLEEALFHRSGGVKELLTANYTFVDSTLASLYGFGASASGFAQVDRPAGQGIGLLAQGSMLAGAAHPDASSPTLRGLVVFERLLCHQKPLPPPNVSAIGAPMPGAKTTRERYEIAHRVMPTCVGCHQFYDPVGFAFEHFDEAGRYRADETGLPIDATGSALAYPDTTVAFSFDGEEDLVQKLAARPEVSDCVSGLAAAYAFAGAGGRTCLAEDARASFASGSLGLIDYFANLAAAPSFVTRQR